MGPDDNGETKKYYDVKEIIENKSIEIKKMELPKVEAIERFRHELTNDILEYFKKKEQDN